MHKKQFTDVQETLYYEVLPNGLHVYLLPKKGYSKTYATFSTQYGSIDNHFQLPNEEELQITSGVAHFLEHKLFEKEAGDIFQVFSQQGAAANAYTTFGQTSYLFTCTDQVDKNLLTLLDFVQTPYFTDATVEKEKGIIGQEIRMYDDHPDFRIYFNLLQCMYESHPVRETIAGTEESIASITPELLYKCYNTFYHPANMLLFVVGPIDAEMTMELIRENQVKKEFPKYQEVQRFYPTEPEHVTQQRTELNLSVGAAKCMLGFKENEIGLIGEPLLKQELYMLLLLDILIGESSSLYEQLYNEGLIGDDLSVEYSSSPTYGHSLIGGNTSNPEKLIMKLTAGIETLRHRGISEEQFERSKKKQIGSYLRFLNRLDLLANQYTTYKFNDIELFDVLPVLNRLSIDEAHQRFRDHFVMERMSVSIINPI